MKTTIAYEVFYFLKVYTFEDFLIFNGLYKNYIANINLKQFTKWYFVPWSFNFV